MVRGWHASLTRDTQPQTDTETGEVRVPIDLFDVDVHQGASELVLTRREARTLRDHLVGQSAAHQPEATP
ncbi:hypothetical protein J7E97_11610 [Streptomyces sp. ISL-66]|uniref:hypothetical protein n=1 Tax=Streptomyces sp. ISL-66 TaxID=2819186 RepID=UPI001BE4F184|nr:hypothetical protein [Streptomyces sp. ISL-66]MBT2468507.1 hypothetical protein [Streptomyces sp. ISL-66]